MLPKQNRLNTEELQGVLKSGLNIHSTLLSFKYKPVLGSTTSKFSFVVSNKVSKSSPKRNLLKRRGRNVLYKQILKIKKGFWGVFFFKPNSPKANFKQIEDDILYLLKKAGLLN